MHDAIYNGKIVYKDVDPFGYHIYGPGQQTPHSPTCMYVVCRKLYVRYSLHTPPPLWDGWGQGSVSLASEAKSSTKVAHGLHACTATILLLYMYFIGSNML